MGNQMSEYKLYGMAESGHTYKVALMLELMGADWQAEFVDFFNGETRTEKYRTELNAMGEVPVLIVDGQKMTQSGVIMDYLAEKHNQFGGNTADEKREILRWVLYDNHKLSALIGPYRFMKFIKDMPDNDVTAFLKGRFEDALSILDKHLTDKDWVVLNRPTLADFSLCSYLYFGDEWGFDAEKYTNIVKWLDNLKGLKGWKHPYDLLPKGLNKG